MLVALCHRPATTSATNRQSENIKLISHHVMTVPIQFLDKHNAPVEMVNHMKTSYLVDVYFSTNGHNVNEKRPSNYISQEPANGRSQLLIPAAPTHKSKSDFAAKAHMLLHPIFNHCAIFPLPKVWRKADQDGRQIDKSGNSSKRSAPRQRYSKSSFQGIRSLSCVNCGHVSTIPLHSANFLANHVIAVGELFGFIRKIGVEPCRFSMTGFRLYSRKQSMPLDEKKSAPVHCAGITKK